MVEPWGNIDCKARRAIATGVLSLAQPAVLNIPTINEGVVGLIFVETGLKNFAVSAKWVKFPQR